MFRNHSLSAALADEFATSNETMERFIKRFAPSRVAANAYHSANDTMLFVHIPKTAGVSVGRSLRKAFDQFHSVEWNDIPKSFRQATRTATYAQTRMVKRHVIMGHFGWPELQLWRSNEMPLKCGAIFRHPVARAISNYNYNCSDAHPGSENFKKKFPSLVSYLQQLPLDVQLTQAIGLVDSFETALKKLLSYYTFIGVTERLSESLQHLGKSHGLENIREYRENVGQIKAKEEVSDSIRKIIEDKSYNDLKVHRLMMRIYEL